MQLKVYNKVNSFSIHSDIPVVRINSVTGVFKFSKEATLLLEINKDKRISFANDESSRLDWFVFFDKEEGFKIKMRKDRLCSEFNCTSMAKNILNSIDKRLKSATFRIQRNPVEFEGKNYFLLITSSPLNTKF